MLSFIMNIILKNLLPLIWHAIKRFGSVFFVGIFAWMLFSHVMSYQIIKKSELKAREVKQYNLGYTLGYKQCSIDNPTYNVNNGGTVVNNSNKMFKIAGFDAELLPFQIKIGY